MKRCSRCGEQKADFYRNSQSKDGLTARCRDCMLAASRAWAKANAKRKNEHRALARVGITPERRADLLAKQDGMCVICMADVSRGGRQLDVDHDHRCCPGRKSCGRCIRGLLCSECNTGIGLFGDNPWLLERAAAYVRGEEVEMWERCEPAS